MNQTASATRRAPADSTPSAGGCCPMLNASFFGLQTPAAASQCFLNPQAQQIVQLARQQQSNVVLSPQQQTVSQQPSSMVGQQQLQAQPQQQTTQRSHDQTSNHYSTSPLTAPNLSLQQSVPTRHSTPNCAALAAIAANFPQFQQQLLLAQNHQSAPNQPTQTVASSTTGTQPNASSTFTTQVPPYNTYSPTQPFINLSRHSVPQSTPPVAAHHQQQTNNNIPNSILPTNLNSIAQNTPLSNSLHQNVQQPRPPVNNTALNSSSGQLADSIYRGAQRQPTDQASNVHQQQSSTSTPAPAQQLGLATRNILSDEALNILINSNLQNVLMERFFSNPQFGPALQAPQTQSQQLAAPQQSTNTSRTQTTLPSTGQSPVVMTPAQQVTLTQIAPPQQHRPSEQASENHNQQQVLQLSNIQSRLNQGPPQQTLSNDSYQSSVGSTAGGSFQSPSNSDMHTQRNPSDQVLQAHQAPQTVSQLPSVPMQPQSHQHPQPQASLGLPFYPYTQDRTMEHIMALLANPALASNLLSHVFSVFQSGLRMEQHPHHLPAHHFHPHLHGTHHHHGQNGQTNGQDASMPLDSLSINESKPRGLSRAEIDSLTPYMHTNEKDARSCVICLSKFELKSKIRPLPCSHAFHAKCVDKWLRTNRTCPICRRDALKTFNGKIKRI